MPRVEFTTQTSLSWEQVVELLTDFSDRRPERWPGLSPKFYVVYSVGDKTAEIKEGNPPNVWARERYDWSQPNLVRWEVVESSFCAAGSFVEMRPVAGDAGRTTLHVTWNRTPTNFQGRLVGLLVKATAGMPVRKSFEAGLRKAELASGA